MATSDDTKLILQIAADTAQLKRAMKAANDDVRQATDGMVKSFGKVGPAVDQQSRSIEKSMRGAQQATRNLTFQLNDVVGSLLGGASPFQVMSQQASQATDAINDLSRSGGLLKGIGSAFGSFLNPASLAVSAAILGFGYLTKAALDYFSEAGEGGKQSSAELSKQVSEIKEIAATWSTDATPALKEYLGELLKVAQAAELAAKQHELLERVFKPAKEEVKALGGEIADMQSQLQAAGMDNEANKLGNAFAAVTTKIEANQPALEELKTLQAVIAELLKTQNQNVIALGQSIQQRLLPYLEQAATLAKEIRFEPRAGTNPSLPPEQRPGAFDQSRAKMLDEQQKRFSEAMGEAGIQIEKFVDDVIQSESRGKGSAKNPNSSATGYGQFIDSTWLEVFKRNFANEAAGMSDSAILALRSDLDTNRSMIRALATENAKLLMSGGQAVNEASLQLAHFLGAGGALKVLKSAPGTRISDIPGMADAVAANPKQLGGNNTRESVLAYAASRTRTQGNREEKQSLEDLLITEKERRDLQAEINTINADASRTDEQRLYAIDELVKRTELLSAAKRQEIELTPAAVAAINSEATAYATLEQQKRQITNASKARQDERKQVEALAEAYTTLARNAVSGFVQDLRNGVSAGEAFNNMLGRIVDTIIDMAIQSLFAKDALGGVISNFVKGFAGGGVSVAHHGTKTGGSTAVRNVSPAMFAGAPRLHNGLLPGEFPAILQRGETVIPKGTARAGGGVGNKQTYNNDITIDVATGMVTANNDDARTLGRRIDTAVQAVLVRESRPGGLLRRPG
jgi:predicted  nucleic acid-binding Zn-ribbon protein